MNRREGLVTIGLTFLICVVVAFAVGYFANGGSDTNVNTTVPTMVATVELAPNGMAYCPADPAVPHVTPCLNKP